MLIVCDYITFMILYSLDKVICVRFILPAGFAEFSTAINTIFNQHRSTYYSSFCKSYNIFTEKFPNDLVLPVRVFIPLAFSGADNCTFLIGSPFLSFFFKKLNIFFTYFVSSFFYCFFNILDLFKLAILKSLFCFFVSGLLLRYCLFSVIGG